MTDPPTGEPLPYEQDQPNSYRWTSDAYDALAAGHMVADITSKHAVSTARISGPCPRCGHEVNFSLLLDAVTGERSGTLGDDSPTIAADVDSWVSIAASCRCGEHHPGRPEKIDYGCGINFAVEIEGP